MEKLIQPFLALRPHPQLAESVIAPPYDVLNDSEARVMVQDKPNSFLHISKPQVDLSDSIDPYSEIVYQKGKDNFEKLKSGGILVRDTMPCFYIYRIERDGHQQTGVSCVASVEAYDSKEYRELSKLRQKATENSTFTIIEGLDEAAKLRKAMGK